MDTRGFVRNSLDFMHVTLDRWLQLIVLFKDIQIVVVELPYELHLNVNIAKLPENSANGTYRYHHHLFRVHVYSKLSCNNIPNGVKYKYASFRIDSLPHN